MDASIFRVGAVATGLAVAIGAFGAHGLKTTLEANQRLATFETATQYHMYHGLALLLLALAAPYLPLGAARTGMWLFVAGILVFSGSLYILSITNIKWLGAITPIGGIFFLAAWGWLFYKAGRIIN